MSKYSMERAAHGFLLAALVGAAGSAVAAEYVNGARVDGAEPGEWTHDWDVATVAAKKDGKPVFVNFTGSDWCPWCKVLERQVFSQAEWRAWASNNVYLVRVDFPNDKSLVPEKYRDRNRELSRRYNVGGYPTCHLFDPADLDNPIGHFGASRDVTPSNFIEKVSAAMPGAKTDAPAFVNGVRVDGANPGEWTHDWDAATAAAKKDGKTVFVNFTGSDWCGWCKLLKQQVFSTPEWGGWASNHVYLVHLDFPKNKDLVPEKYRDRNRELSRRYNVGGYPTCHLFDPADLDNPIGHFGASRDVTPSNFIEKVSAAMPGAKTKSEAPVEERKDGFRRPTSPRPAARAAVRDSSGAVTGNAGKLPVGKLPADGRISWFDFSEGPADKVSSGRSFDCRNVPLDDGAMRFNGVYVHSIEGRTNGCNAVLSVPELDYDGFTVCLSFRPERDGERDLPLLNFGHSRRWFSANVGADGCLWFGLNCYDVRIPTGGRVADGEWNWLVCSVDAVGKTVRAALNGVRLEDNSLPRDFFYKILPDQVESMKTVDTTFWNGGRTFKGDIAHFVLFGHPLGEDDFKAFSAPSAPSGWTAEFGSSKSLYWNATVSNAQCRFPARVDEHGDVILHPGLPGASGPVDLRGPISDASGRTLRLVGIGQNPDIETPLFSGLGGNASSVLLPGTVEWIGASGFKGCRNLRSLKVPASVKRIGADAFADCPALERIEFEDRSFKLDDRVFGSPRNGETVHRPSTNLGNE